MSVTVGTWRRYSWRAVSRPAKPRCQPSIIASENAHAQDVAHVANVSARHGSRCAMVGPHSTAAMPMTTAGTVPHPTWAFHHPKIGAVPAKILKRSGVLLISGVTMPRCRCGTTNAATTRAAPRATAIASLRPTFTPASLLPTGPCPSPFLSPSCRERPPSCRERSPSCRERACLLGDTPVFPGILRSLAARDCAQNAARDGYRTPSRQEIICSSSVKS